MLKLEKIDKRVINGLETPVRIYRDTATESEVVTYLLRTDANKNTWLTFEDLFTVPFIRQLAAKKVLDLYGHGLALEDIKAITAQVKATLRSNAPEKYEMAYAKLLELEALTETTADPVKQCIGLCTVYLLLNDEVPDVWTNNWSAQKMTYLSLDLDLQAFFLSWWTGIMRLSGSLLKGLSLIASTAASAPSASNLEAP